MGINDVAKCGAQTRSGGRCQQPVMAGRNRCRLHGGKTPRGLANPRTITGRYSRDMPTRLLARYEEAQQDREALSIRNEIAFVTAVIGARMEELEKSGRQLDWSRAIAQFAKVTEEGRDWPWERVQAEMQVLGVLLQNGRTERRILKEIRSLIDQRARLVAQEAKRQEDLKQNLTLEEAIVYAQVLAAIIRKYVTDRAILAAINREFQAVANAPVIDVASVSADSASRNGQD